MEAYRTVVARASSCWRFPVRKLPSSKEAEQQLNCRKIQQEEWTRMVQRTRSATIVGSVVGVVLASLLLLLACTYNGPFLTKRTFVEIRRSEGVYLSV